MRVQYKLLGVSGWNLLFDDSQSGGTKKVTFNDVLNVSPGFGAGSVGVLPEGNCSCSVSLSQMLVIYATESAAQKSTRVMRQALSGKRLHLQITAGTDTEFYPNGSLKMFEPSQSGQSVTYNLSFQTEDVTATAPTT